MSYFGFSDDMVHWIRSYLSLRPQITKLGDECQAKMSYTRGVPQGSFLGADPEQLVYSWFPQPYSEPLFALVC